jgi:REP element-mobilizing transposase RayT
MPQSLARIPIHFVWGTKYRQPFIRPEIEIELFKYMASIFREHESPCLAINGMPDHVHMLSILSRKVTVATLIEEVKKSSSKWMKTKGIWYRDFYWQNGYAAFGVGENAIEVVKSYIDHQKTHHLKKSFRREYLDYFEVQGMAYKENYLWD